MNKEYVEHITKLAQSLEVEKPVAYVLLVSNGVNFQGGGQVSELDNVDKVDLVAYLIRCLGIDLDDVAEQGQLNAEITLMGSIIRRGG